MTNFVIRLRGRGYKRWINRTLLTPGRKLLKTNIAKFGPILIIRSTLKDRMILIHRNLGSPDCFSRDIVAVEKPPLGCSTQETESERLSFY